MSNRLDPDQARHFVGPDLGPNYLQRLSADNTSRQRVSPYPANFFAPKCSLLITSAAYIQMHTRILLPWEQTLNPEEQSDLGPLCLQYRLETDLPIVLNGEKMFNKIVTYSQILITQSLITKNLLKWR